MVSRLSPLPSLLLLLSAVGGLAWPVPYNRTQSRPARNPKCFPNMLPFCAKGLSHARVPSFFPNDLLSFFALSRDEKVFEGTPISTSLKTYAIGVSSAKTGQNYTFSWLPMTSTFDAAIPRVISKDLLWCNQAALCVEPGIDRKAWPSVVKFANMSGNRFDDFTTWAKYLNNSQPFQQTFLTQASKDGQVWMTPYEDQAFLNGAVALLRHVGAQFFPTTLKFTWYTLVSDQPEYLGNATYLKSHASSVFSDIVSFYNTLQKASGISYEWKKLMFWMKVHVEHKFYYYFNSAYWRLHVRDPYLKITTVPVKLS